MYQQYSTRFRSAHVFPVYAYAVLKLYGFYPLHIYHNTTVLIWHGQIVL